MAGEVICTVATGDLPAPVSLSPDFTEQGKEIITHLIQGDGSLFLDNIPTGTRFDSGPLASAMTNPRYKGRLLGGNKQIQASTRTMVVANGNSLNLAGDLASRFALARLDTGLERPEDRSGAKFKIPDLRAWIVEYRQRLVGAVHTIVRAYLQECRRCGKTPPNIVDRRHVDGTRFGGQCEVLRDAFLWAFPDLPDPFLSFQASALNSSTKAEAALVLEVLDRVMTKAAGQICAPGWASTPFIGAPSPERTRWENKFRVRWNCVPPDQRQRRYRTADLTQAENQAWERLRGLVRLRFGRPEVRAGRIRLTSSEITKELQSAQDERAIVEGAMHGKVLNPVSLGRWLKEHLVDAPINGRVLRSAQGRANCAEFWIRIGVDANMSEKWIENSKGNWVWVSSDRLRATVYGTHDGMWGAIWNGAVDGRPRRLKAKFECAEDAERRSRSLPLKAPRVQSGIRRTRNGSRARREVITAG